MLDALKANLLAWLTMPREPKSAGPVVTAFVRFSFGLTGIVFGLIISWWLASIRPHSPSETELFGLTVGVLIVLPGPFIGYFYAQRAARLATVCHPTAKAHSRASFELLAFVGLVPTVAVALHYQQDLKQTPPTDDVMIANFASHRAEFTQIVRIYQSDEHGVTKQSKQVLPTFTRDIGTSAPDDENFDGTVLLTYWPSKMLDNDCYTEKGYVFCPTPPTDQVTNTCINESGSTVYRHIVGQWYIYSYPVDNMDEL